MTQCPLFLIENVIMTCFNLYYGQHGYQEIDYRYWYMV